MFLPCCPPVWGAPTCLRDPAERVPPPPRPNLPQFSSGSPFQAGPPALPLPGCARNFSCSPGQAPLVADAGGARRPRLLSCPNRGGQGRGEPRRAPRARGRRGREGGGLRGSSLQPHPSPRAGGRRGSRRSTSPRQEGAGGALPARRRPAWLCAAPCASQQRRVSRRRRPGDTGTHGSS